jgi:tRNA threonylcarbamoyladenosine biosynthesis protein TsaE
MTQPFTFTSHSPDETAELAQRLAVHLRPGDVILLEGHIGGGKTHFARSLIQSLLTTPEDVPSPTFTLVQTYDTPDFEIWHSDLYRLSHPDDVFELGLTETFETAVCLVEWPDRLGDLVPKQSLTLGFSASDAAELRTITVSYTDPRWDFLAGLVNV